MKTATTHGRKLRACMSCGLLKTSAAFKSEGCDNCPLLLMKKNARNVFECTSDSFRGMVCMQNSRASWVGKWLRISACHDGMYALTVEGILPEHCIETLERGGKSYMPRDKSFTL